MATSNSGSSGVSGDVKIQTGRSQAGTSGIVVLKTGSGGGVHSRCTT